MIYILHVIKKNKEIIIVLFIILLFITINIYNYINQSLFIPFYPMKGINSFAFWNFVRNNGIAQVVIFLSPILIIISGVYSFYSKMNSGMYQNILVRMEYKKFVKKEIFKSYLKGSLIIPIISLFVFIIGLILLPNNISIFDSSVSLLFLPNGLSSNPYLYVLLVIILNLLYGIFITNIGLIISQYTKKFHLLLIASFIVINSINFLVGNIGMLIANILKNQSLYNIAVNINIYDGYSPQSTLLIAYITMIIYIIISFIILIKLYNKKERLLKVYE